MYHTPRLCNVISAAPSIKIIKTKPWPGLQYYGFIQHYIPPQSPLFQSLLWVVPFTPTTRKDQIEQILFCHLTLSSLILHHTQRNRLEYNLPRPPPRNKRPHQHYRSLSLSHHLRHTFPPRIRKHLTSALGPKRVRVRPAGVKDDVGLATDEIKFDEGEFGRMGAEPCAVFLQLGEDDLVKEFEIFAVHGRHLSTCMCGERVGINGRGGENEYTTYANERTADGSVCNIACASPFASRTVDISDCSNKRGDSLHTV